MRILHVAETAKGGVGTYLDEIASQQADELGPAAVRVLVPDCHAAQLGRVPASSIATFRRTGRSPANMLRLQRTLAAELRAFAPDVVHAHSFFAGVAARLLPRRPDGPARLYCPHGWAFDITAPRWQQRLLQSIERTLTRRCDGVVAISAYEADRARRIGIALAGIHLVPNGISASAPSAAPLPWDDERLKILFVGRLDRQKGFDILLNAVAGDPERFCVRAAGGAVANEAASDRLPANVELLGWLAPQAIEGALQQADIVVMPSRWEGFGLAALEAMRAGKPVIAARVGGLAEVVEDGVTGRLVPPDDAAALRRALLADDAESRKRLGRQGRERFLERFTAERTHRQLLDLYAELASRRTIRRPELVMQERWPLAGQP